MPLTTPTILSPSPGAQVTQPFTLSWSPSVQSGGSNQAPIADFTFVVNGLQVQFTDASSDPDGSIASRSWDFGDSSTSTVTNPSRTYASAATRAVTLVVTDNAGATHSVTRSVTTSAGTTVTSDFGAQTVGQPLTGWTSRWDGTLAEWQVVAETATATSTSVSGKVAAISPPAAGIRRGLAFDAAGTTFTVGSVRARLRTTDTQFSNTSLGVVFRGAGSAAAPDGYAAVFFRDANNVNSLRIVKHVAGVVTILAQSADNAWVAGTTYELVIDAPASNLFTATLYAATDTGLTTPLATAAMTVADTTFATGWVGLMARGAGNPAGSATHTFGRLSVTTPPPAPLAANFTTATVGQVPANFALDFDATAGMFQAADHATHGRSLATSDTNVTDRNALRWAAAGTITDADIVLQTSLIPGPTNGTSSGLVVRGSGTGAAESGYRILVGYNGGLASRSLLAGKWVAGAGSTFQVVPFVWVDDALYNVRVRIEGARLRVKAWLASEAEPVTWQIDATDPDASFASGWLGLFQQGDTAVRHRYVAVATGGASAPLPGA